MTPTYRRKPVRTVLTGGALAGLALGGCASTPPPGMPVIPDELTAADRPNIVVILTDDLSTNLVPYLSEVEEMAEGGTTFTRHVVTTPQCSPSRASLLTGQYPHSNLVKGNAWPSGGFGRLLERGSAATLGTAMQDAEYRTAFMGKVMNGYRVNGLMRSPSDGHGGPPAYPPGYVLPGWDEWYAVGEDGYREFGYRLATAVDTDQADVTRYGFRESDYLTDVLAAHAEDFITSEAEKSDGPFLLMISTFATHTGGKKAQGSGHARFAAAPRDRPQPGPGVDWPRRWAQPEFERGDCGADAGGCDAVPWPDPPDEPSFNQLTADGPAWLPSHRLSATEVASMGERHTDRIRMAQALNDLVGGIRDTLARTGITDRTYVVFTSDNGYHLGEHALGRGGKMSPFDHDAVVPLVIEVPGRSVPTVVDTPVQNVDLLPTFLELAKEAVPQTVEGISLVSMLDGVDGGRATLSDATRSVALVEFSRHRKTRPRVKTVPDAYAALRTSDYLYVDRSSSRAGLPRITDIELYLDSDPGQLVNVAASLTRHERVRLDRALEALVACSGHSCRLAAKAAPRIGPLPAARSTP